MLRSRTQGRRESVAGPTGPDRAACEFCDFTQLESSSSRCTFFIFLIGTGVYTRRDRGRQPPRVVPVVGTSLHRATAASVDIRLSCSVMSPRRGLLAAT